MEKLEEGATACLVARPTNEPEQQLAAAGDVKNKDWWKFYVMRPGLFEQAVEIIVETIDKTADGEHKSAWLLAEIDHWDMETERIVILTTSHMMVFKFNFSTMCVDACRKFKLRCVDSVQAGEFLYPKKHVMPARSGQTGVRVCWNNKEVLSLWQRFSPLFNSPSYVTFTEHKATPQMQPLPYYMDTRQFKRSVITAAQTAGAHFEGIDGPIHLEVYLGAASRIHNSPDLGYCVERVIATF